MRVYYIFLSILVCFLEVSSVICATIKPQCPNCTVQHVKTVNAVTGKCVDCWPCPECNEGSGSSVLCGSTVTVGTKLHCVPCVHGANFSDSSGTDQCQPCGICLGKHEHVHSECRRDSDIKCECEVGFYRNKTTQECTPCASCCSGDDGILEKCQRDGGKIKKKCKFEDPWPSTTCLSSFKAVATSSSLMTFSYKHSTATPVLSSITKVVPAPSETVHIRKTLASSSGHNSRHTNVLGTSTVNNGHVTGKRSNINTNLSTTAVVLISVLACAFVFTSVCAGFIYFKYRSWRSRNNPHALNMTYNELEARENERRKSSECSGVSDPLLQLTEHPPGGTTLLPLESDRQIYLLPENSEAEAVHRGIPSSLGNEPQNLALPTRKRLASEGDDKSVGSDLEGHRSCCNIEDDQNGSVTVHASVHPAPPSASPNIPCSSSSAVVPASTSTFSNSTDAEQTPATETDMQIQVAYQGAVHGLSVEPPIQSTEDNRGYNTHIKDVPESVIFEMCLLLDEEREIDGKNYRLLASELGLKPAKIRFLKERKQIGQSPSRVLLMQVFSAKENLGTLNHLNSILKKMERFDVIKVLDDWIMNNP